MAVVFNKTGQLYGGSVIENGKEVINAKMKDDGTFTEAWSNYSPQSVDSDFYDDTNHGVYQDTVNVNWQ